MLKFFIILLVALSGFSFASPSSEYSAALTDSAKVQAFMADYYADLGATLMCTAPSVRRVTADLESFDSELQLLSVNRFIVIRPIETDDLAFFLLDWNHARGVGFAGWVKVDDHMMFWSLRCVLRPA